MTWMDDHWWMIRKETNICWKDSPKVEDSKNRWLDGLPKKSGWHFDKLPRWFAQIYVRGFQKHLQKTHQGSPEAPSSYRSQHRCCSSSLWSGCSCHSGGWRKLGVGGVGVGHVLGCFSCFRFVSLGKIYRTCSEKGKHVFSLRVK